MDKAAIETLRLFHKSEMEGYQTQHAAYIKAVETITPAWLTHLEVMSNYHRGAVNALKQVQGMGG